MADTTQHLGLALAFQRANRRRLAVVASLALILIAGAASVFLVRGIEGQLQDVIRTYELRGQARQLVLGLVDAETGQRGYLLTQNEQYLEPYNAAIGGIDGNIHQLLELTPEGGDQRARIDGVIDDIDKKRVEMASTIKLASQGRVADAVAIFNTDLGVRLMENVRDTIGVFIAEEDRQLVERNHAIERYRAMVVAAILVALASAAVLGYAIFARTQRQFGLFSESQSVLASHNEDLEAVVRERPAAVEEAKAHAERERARVETLLQDTNHRIGNSLATVSSLLGLQVNRTHSEEVKSALEAAQNRVHAIASGHRRLRLGADMETTQADEFLLAVVEDLRMTQSDPERIEFVTEFDAVTINARDATTLGIVLGELVTNALKHAFGDARRGCLWVSLKRTGEGHIALSVEDDGAGLAPDIERGEPGLGSMIIRQLAQQFGGEPQYGQRPGGGTIVSIVLTRIERGQAG